MGLTDRVEYRDSDLIKKSDALGVAIEAIGAGRFGFPENDCTDRLLQTIYGLIVKKVCALPPEAVEVVHCKDCEWWTKQSKSLQGRCELMQMYPTGGWYCGNARKRGEPSESHKERKKIWRKA